MNSLPITALFIDCDAFFASCEQFLDPCLRGRPVGVAPVLAETSCCIAASYEAKRLGVKTGTRIGEARVLCPGIQIIEAKPSEYVKIHHRVIAAVEDCIHVEAVLSIDEMWAWLPVNWRDPDFVHALGRKIKARVAERIHETIRVSIGAAPNRYLAKMASKMRKPDGLFVIQSRDLPAVLHELELGDFTGIGKNQEARLHASGIHTVAELCDAPREQLHAAWGNVLGDRFWHLLRGIELSEVETRRKSISHSHVLPPAERAPSRAWPILCKLLHKACERLRHEGLLAGALTMQLGYLGQRSWAPEIRFQDNDGTLFMMRTLGRLWKDRPEPQAPLLKVGVVLWRLSDRSNHTPDLFTEASCEKYARLDAAVDALRRRYGRQCIYYGTVHHARKQAPMRISFHHIPELELESDGCSEDS